MCDPFTLDIPYILLLGPPQDPLDIPLQRPYITPLRGYPTRGPVQARVRVECWSE